MREFYEKRMKMDKQYFMLLHTKYLIQRISFDRTFISLKNLWLSLKKFLTKFKNLE